MNTHESDLTQADPRPRIDPAPRFRRPAWSFWTGAALALSAALPGFAQQAAPAAPPTPNQDLTVVLPEFSVKEPPATQYLASDEVSAARTAGAIIDTPMTVNVITPALMQDIGPDTIFDVAQYFGGVSTGRGTGSGGINDRMTFRGFESFSRTLDNFSGLLFPGTSATSSNIDPVFVEHAELLMGPDTILAPTGTPGGSINLISKSPQFTPSTDVTAEFGSFDANKYTIDSTGPIGDSQHMAYRVIGAYQDTQTYLPGANLMFSGSAQFAYKFSDTAQLTVKYFGTQLQTKGTAAQSNLDGEEVYTPNTVNGATLSNTPQPGFAYDGWNGDASWSERQDRSNIVESELTADLGDHVKMRLAGQVLFDAENNVMAYPSGGMTEKWDPVTGQEISVTPINPAALTEVATWEHSITREIQFQNDYAGSFEAGSVSLQPVLGWTYQQGSTPVDFTLQDHNMPTANLAQGYYDPAQPPFSQFTSVSSEIPSEGWVGQTYAFLKAGFLQDRLFATAGVSRTWADVNDYSYPGIYLPGIGQVGSPAAPTDNTFGHTGSAITPSVKPLHDTYLGGLLFKVLPNLSAYYSYSTNAAVAGSTPLWQDGTQNEFGLKSDFFNKRISVSVDHFEIVENNVSATNPLFNTGQSTIPNIYADETNHGEEINIVGGITRNLSVILSGTEMHLRDSVGRRLRDIPDTMANALVDYRFTDGVLKNADFFVGTLYEGNVAGETVAGYTPLGVPEQPGFYLAPHTVANVGGGYRLGRYHFNLNVDNVLNEKFWWQASSRTSLAPYPGIDVRFTVAIHL